MNSSNIDAHSILTAFDYSSLQDIDPSLQNGARLIFDRQVPFELRIQDEESSTPQEVGTIETIRAKILVVGDEAGSIAPSEPGARSGGRASGYPPLHTVRLELMSDSDLFFHYQHTVREETFKVMREEQRLMIEFEEYPNVLIKMLNGCINEPHRSLAIFLMAQDGQARLDFIQNIQYKFVELLSCLCVTSPVEVIKKQIGFRYGMMKSKFMLLSSRIGDIYQLVKLKNPSLLLQIQKLNANANLGKTSSSIVSSHSKLQK